MNCVTPADLGKPIAAIVERCGAPDSVMTLGTQNSMVYGDSGQGVGITFDADQMRVRVLQFFTYPTPPPSGPMADWNVTLPFQRGAHEISLGHTTLAEVQGALAVDADVTTQYGEAFRSTSDNDVVLAGTEDHILRAAFVGERAALVQQGIIASPLGEAPLNYMSPIPRDAWLRPIPVRNTGPRSTIFRIDVDAEGIARKVSIVIPSGDAAFDASTQQRIGDAKFRPATLDKRPVSGTCFVQVHH
jgi:hypothetical protein